MLSMTRRGDRSRPAARGVREFLHTIARTITQIGQRARSVVRNALQPLQPATAAPDERPSATAAGAGRWDRARQLLNLVFAVGQAVTTGLVYLTGVDEVITSNTTATAPIVPAGYAFSIWGLIYGATIAYGVFQALPSQRENALLRRVGWRTALAFLGTSLWLVAAVNNQYWTTVAIFFGILAALAGAFAELIRHGAPRTARERYLVALPIAVYLGWASVATVANVATALTASGYAELGLGAQPWAVIMLVAAGVIGAAVTRLSRGNVAYALTVVWALGGIVAANAPSAPPVALAAGGMAVVVGLALLREQRRR